MNYWNFIHTKLNQNYRVYLLIVIHHKGSSPGRQGFKMVVSEDSEIYGSIGGGIMEYTLVELCKELLQKETIYPFVKHQIHKGEVIDGSGMICSGEQTVLFYPLQKSDSTTIDRIISAYKDTTSGILTINPREFKFTAHQHLSTRYNYSHTSTSDWSYQEFLNKKDTVYIIGGGHVSLAVSKLLNQLGFYVVVYDNRSNINTFEENTYADKKQIVDYLKISNHIPDSNFAYIAIMTNKYTEDKLVLNKLIQHQFKYIGVLGSKAKLKLMFEVLEKEGVPPKLLNKVYAPIGLNIPSQTPDEIAVSIAAQMIKVRNRNDRVYR